MTAATGQVFSIKPFADDDAIPFAGNGGLAAGQVPYKNWFLGFNPATGYVVQQSAGTAGLVSFGFSDRNNAGNASTANEAIVIGRQQFVSGFPNSTGASDAILATDYAVTCWAVDNQTVGKLSNLSGVNRSMLGVAFGIDPDNSTPIVYPGPIGWLLGRLAHMADNAQFGSHTYAVDAGAGTDLTEVIFSNPRQKLHGVITGIEYIPNATLGADGTNYKTLTVTKYDSTGSNGVVVGTLTTIAGFTKWTAAAFTLTATAANLQTLEGDIFTIQNSHAASGAVTPAGVLRVMGKVQ